METTSPSHPSEIKDNKNHNGEDLNFEDNECIPLSSDYGNDSGHSCGSFGEIPHPKFDSTNVLDRLREIDVGQELLDTVQGGNKSSRDSVVEEIMSKARRSLLERDLLTEDVLEPVDKVYTIGCFDVFHPGHELLLKRMRSYGKKVRIKPN